MGFLLIPSWFLACWMVMVLIFCGNHHDILRLHVMMVLAFLKVPAWFFMAVCHDGFDLFEGSSMIFYGYMSWWFLTFRWFHHDFLKLHVMMVFRFLPIPSWHSCIFDSFLSLSWFLRLTFHVYSTVFSACHDFNPKLFMTIPPLSQPVMISKPHFSCLFRDFFLRTWLLTYSIK